MTVDRTAPSVMSENARTIVIFGAGGTTGAATVAMARDRGLTVRAVEHEWPLDAPDGEAVSHHSADVMDDDLAPLVDSADAVISAIGLSMSVRTVANPPPLYTKGTANIVQAMQKTGVRRLAVISATFVEDADAGPLWFRVTAMPALANIYAQMARMEAELARAEGIDWTAARPGWLLDRPYTGDYQVTDEKITHGLLRTRHADLADFLLRCVTEDLHIGETPAIARRESELDESPLALKNELV
ncbi:NAD(P)-dependent oxidoreductase [Parasphingopyxis sp.]|uniref:NAD(P)-dependent oxidoreductase n=1 Tax=Parasphingopyxis sp. TaxID=1920299 RepID=UPI00261F8AA2|nr:NAD(P)H-binding protein [Parasphingopyxis sp.]